MGLKTDFLAALNEDLPSGISGLLTKAIPEAPSVSIPTDVDEAIMAQGVLAKYLLDLLDTFHGLTPIELLLRIGQKNATLQAALLAGLEYVEGEEYDFIQNLDPTIVYTASPIQVKVTITKGINAFQGMFCNNNNGAFEMTRVGQSFVFIGSYQWEDAGTETFYYTALFNASDGSYACQKSVMIQIGEGFPPP